MKKIQPQPSADCLEEGDVETGRIAAAELAPRGVSRRPLSVDKCPSLMTYATVPQCTEPGGKCGIGQLVMTRPDGAS